MLTVAEVAEEEKQCAHCQVEARANCARNLDYQNKISNTFRIAIHGTEEPALSKFINFLYVSKYRLEIFFLNLPAFYVSNYLLLYILKVPVKVMLAWKWHHVSTLALMKILKQGVLANWDGL